MKGMKKMVNRKLERTGPVTSVAIDPVTIQVLDRIVTGDKRTYLPFLLKVQCPACETRFTKNLASEEYLSHPAWNSDFKFGIYCDECGHEWNVQLRLTVTLEVA